MKKYKLKHFILREKTPNIVNQKFNYLTTISFCRYDSGHAIWKCKCDCGNIAYVQGDKLINGYAKSCGCYRTANTIKRSTKHGQATRKNMTQEYRSYHDMKKRCYSSKNIGYKNYGGRGIKVCDRWLESFENFYNDMGKCPKGYSLDRINNDGNYEPSNCRWASNTTQGRNSRHTKLTLKKAQKIRKLNLQGVSRKELQKLFNVGKTTIAKVINYITWKE